MNNEAHAEQSRKSYLAGAYFELRLNLEKELKKFKEQQNVVKSELNKRLKKFHGVSKRRISDAIYAFKKYKAKTDINIYDLIIHDLDEVFVAKYDKHKEDIVAYINEMQRLQEELYQFRKEKKKELAAFKKLHKADLTLLNYAYNKFSNDVKTFKKLDLSIDEFRQMNIDNKYLDKVIFEFFYQEVQEVITARDIIKKEKEIKAQNDQLYVETINSMFVLTPKDAIKKSKLFSPTAFVRSEKNDAEIDKVFAEFEDNEEEVIDELKRQKE